MAEVSNKNIKLNPVFILQNGDKPAIHRRYLNDKNFSEALEEVEIEDTDGMDEIMEKLKLKGWVEQNSISGAGMASSIDYSAFEPGESCK